MGNGSQYTVLGNAEAYLEDATRARGGKTPRPHRSLEEAKASLLPQIAQVQVELQQIPEKCRLDEVVAELRLDVSRIAKSHHPGKLLRDTGFHLRGVGSWRQTLSAGRGKHYPRSEDPDAAEESTEVKSRSSRSLLVSGPPSSFSKLQDLIRDIVPDSGLMRDIIGLEAIRLLVPSERLAIKDAGEEEVAIEIVLYAWNETRRQRAIEGIREIIGNATADSGRLLIRSYPNGPTFIAALVSPAMLPELANLNYLRLTRSLPRVALTRTALGMQIPAPLAGVPHVSPIATIAVFDGGVANLDQFRGLVEYSELTVAPCTAELLDHGTAVVSAAIYGDIANDQLLPIPRCKVRAFRVMPDPNGSHFELWGVIDRLEERVPGLPADIKIINLSVGPLGPIDDVPCRFTFAIDRLSYEYDKLFITAVGNWGEEADVALRRIQSPADAVNAVAVGAYTRVPTTGERTIASYSSTGPGRIGCARKPELLAFGGCPRMPFYALDAHSGQLRGVAGTSYAAPTVAALVAQLISGRAVSTQGGRALLIHAATPLASSPSASLGVASEMLEEVLACTPTRVSVLYQGELSPRKSWRLPFLMPSGLTISGNVKLSWTLVYSCEVEQGSRDEYTLGGIELQFRPHARKFCWSHRDNDDAPKYTLHADDNLERIADLEKQGYERGINPVSDSTRSKNETSLRGMGAKFDTVVPGFRSKRGSSLFDSALTVSFVGRSTWDDAQDIELVRSPFAAVLTVQADHHVGDLYAEVVKAHSALRALAITNQTAVPVSLG